MVELRTLGSVHLRGPGGPLDALAGRSKRLALLVYLAAARPAGPRRRDQLLELFWPDASPEHGRGALRQSLQFLVTTLGPDLLTGRGTDAIALAPDRLWCDAVALERAADAGRDAEALRLFGGDFLAGFALPECPEFEVWCSDVRLRLRRRAATSAAVLTREAERAGAWDEASTWAQRWLELQPDDEEPLRVSLRALMRQELRTRALELASEFETRLRRELGATPSTQTRALVDSLRTGRWSAGSGGAAERPATEPSPGSVAVLPFLNLTGDPDLDYFCDGITEELIADLSMLAGLSVAARTSSFAFRNRAADVRDVGRRLGVANLVEGNMRRAGAAVRVTVQLVETARGFHLWAESFDHSLAEAVRMPAELVRRIAPALQRSLLEPVPRRPSQDTQDREAFLLFLRGQHHLYRRTPEDLARSAELFARAGERDPRYAAAHGGLALALASMPVYCGTPTGVACPRALEVADIALGLDRTVASAHLARSLALAMHRWDWRGAEESALAALAGTPKDPVVRSTCAFYVHAHDGRFEQALAEATASRDADPLSLPAISYVGYVAYLARDWKRAEAAAREALDLDPGFPLALWVLEMVLEAKGEFEDALGVARTLVARSPASAMFRAHLARALGLLGRVEAEGELGTLAAGLPPESPVWYWVAGAHAALGGIDQGLDALERAVENRSNFLVFAAVHPTLDPFRGHPRFTAILRRLDLPVTLR
ncbi:MAG TPA: BTAD domain-containing putative transcriptional regulator [Myxococcaceae bacterium]|nr:BTAD domain-containing putative transcriptional regulator [Myxococcaceae bacterium]